MQNNFHWHYFLLLSYPCQLDELNISNNLNFIPIVWQAASKISPKIPISVSHDLLYPPPSQTEQLPSNGKNGKSDGIPLQKLR